MTEVLMIPGPIEISEAVQRAYSIAPPSHLAPHVIEAFGRSLERMREVWCASPDAQPFVIAGSGTLAMEMAAANVVDPGEHVLVVNTGYFSDRMAEMLRRRGAVLTEVSADLGDTPGEEEITAALESADFKAVFATHVDTSTGVRVDAEMISRLAPAHDALSVFDGVCATAGEAFEMQAWGADIYLTGSQKALGLPAGLALLVASKDAMAAREELDSPPPMSIDFHQWLPIMNAYEGRGKSYFATPATTMILALDVALGEILDCTHGDATGIAARIAQHEHVASAMRQTWAALGLELLPASGEIAANTLSAIRYPEGVGAELVGEISERGVIVAGGLHPELKTEYFRVGHMGDVITRRDALIKTVEAVEGALIAVGVEGISPGTAKAAFEAALAN